MLGGMGTQLDGDRVGMGTGASEMGWEWGQGNGYGVGMRTKLWDGENLSPCSSLAKGPYMHTLR